MVLLGSQYRMFFSIIEPHSTARAKVLHSNEPVL